MKVHAALFATVLIWASAICIAKAALADVPALVFVFLRMAFIFPIVLGHTLWISRKKKIPWMTMLGLGLLGHTAFQYFFAHGLEKTSTFHASILLSSTPLIIALIVFFTRTETISSRRWGGIFLAMVALVFFLKPDQADDTSMLMGDISALIAIISWSLFSVLASRPTIYKNLTSLELSSITLALGTPWMYLYAHNPLMNFHWDLSAFGWAAIIFSGFFPVLIAYALWMWAISKVGPVTVSVYNFLVPPLTAIFAAIFLHEQFTVRQMALAAIVLLGTSIAGYKRTNE